jgi:hypothetical protein
MVRASLSVTKLASGLQFSNCGGGMFEKEKQQILDALNALTHVAYRCPGSEVIRDTLVALHNVLLKIEQEKKDDNGN